MEAAPITSPLLVSPLAPPPNSCSVPRPIKLVATCAITIGSIFARVYGTGPAFRALSSIGIGIGLQSTVQTVFSDNSTQRIQQVAKTVCGQTSVFILSYLWSNFTSTQAVALTGIGITLGANGVMYAKHYVDKWFNRVDSVPSQEEQAVKFSPSFPTFIPPIASLLLPAASVGSLLGWFFTENAVAKGICSFASTFYAAQFASQFFCNKVDEKLSRMKGNTLSEGISQLKSSRWRVLKGVINGLAPIAIPLMWIPWKGDAQTPERMAQLWIVGLVVGFFDGFFWKSHENRFKNKTIDELDELKERTPKTKCIRVWRAVWASLVHASMLAITIRELASEKNALKDKVAIGVMYSGFVLSAIKNVATNALWNLQERLRSFKSDCWSKIKDRLVIQQMLPRFLGISPVYIYLLLTNSIAMRSGQDLNTFHQVLNCIAWYFFGSAMENEFHQSWGEKQGILRLPLMSTISAVLMTIKEMQGEI